MQRISFEMPRNRMCRVLAVASIVILTLVVLISASARHHSAPASIRIIALASFPSAEVLIVGRTDGLYRSVDQGRTWRRVGPEDFVPTALSVEPWVVQPVDAVRPPLSFYAIGADSRVLRSEDDGASWHEMHLPSVPRSTVAMAVVPRTRALLAAVEDSGLWRSQDGEHWESLPTQETAPPLRALAVDPAAPGVLYGTSSGGELWRSRDGGSSWEIISPLEGTGTDAGVRVFIVRRGGMEGAAAHFGCACGGQAAGDTTSIVYALLGGHLYRSFDQGETWGTITTRGIQPDELATLAVDPVNQDILYTTRSHQGDVYRSLDGGYTWRLLALDQSE